MSLGSVARQERSLVCDLMEQVGAGAPTLAEGWTVLDLAAHLVVREHDLWAAPGLVLGGPFRRAIEAAMNRRRRRGLENLVATIRRGPPGVARLLPPGAHLSEYFIHHEDVRRANGLAPRRDRDLDEALALLLRASAPMLLRRVGTGVDLVWNGGVLYRSGPEPRAVLDGPPGELLLYLSGRTRAAGVDLRGDPTAVWEVSTADLRL
ncbi:MAG: TIGR03085 family metal-binding protein [Actinomycetota bacterium]